MSITNSINIFFFGSLAETLKVREKKLSLETLGIQTKTTTAEKLREALADKFDWQTLLQGDIFCAINQTIVDASAVVKAGDEVAFFPPVTGG